MAAAHSGAVKALSPYLNQFVAPITNVPLLLIRANVNSLWRRNSNGLLALLLRVRYKQDKRRPTRRGPPQTWPLLRDAEPSNVSCLNPAQAFFSFSFFHRASKRSVPFEIPIVPKRCRHTKIDGLSCLPPYHCAPSSTPLKAFLLDVGQSECVFLKSHTSENWRSDVVQGLDKYLIFQHQTALESMVEDGKETVNYTHKVRMKVPQWGLFSRGLFLLPVLGPFVSFKLLAFGEGRSLWALERRLKYVLIPFHTLLAI